MGKALRKKVLISQWGKNEQNLFHQVCNIRALKSNFYFKHFPSILFFGSIYKLVEWAIIVNLLRILIKVFSPFAFNCNLLTELLVVEHKKFWNKKFKFFYLLNKYGLNWNLPSLFHSSLKPINSLLDTIKLLSKTECHYNSKNIVWRLIIYWTSLFK